MATAVRKEFVDRNAYYKARRRQLKEDANQPKVCAEIGCGTVLSIYNFNKCCHLHNFSYVKRNKIQLRMEELEAF